MQIIGYVVSCSMVPYKSMSCENHRYPVRICARLAQHLFADGQPSPSRINGCQVVRVDFSLGSRQPDAD